MVAAGLALLTVGMWLPDMGAFVAGSVVAGAGAGLVFKGALSAASITAPPQMRGEVLAGYFLAVYLGVSVPAVGLGLATMHFAARDAMIVFVVVVAAVTGAAAISLGRTSPPNGPALLDRPRPVSSRQPGSRMPEVYGYMERESMR